MKYSLKFLLQNERLTTKNKVLLSIFVSFVHVFCYLNLEEQNTKLKIITYYSIMLVENVLLMTLWTLGTAAAAGPTASPANLASGEDLQWYPYSRDRIYVAVFTSFFIGLLFMIIYYKFFHVRKLSATLSYSPTDVLDNKVKQANNNSSAAREVAAAARAAGGHLGRGQDPAVTVFNCALNPALRKKKKLPSRSVPPPGSGGGGGGGSDTSFGAVPFWKEPLPGEVRTEGDGFSYSRTTSVDDIRQKLQVGTKILIK